LGSAARTDKAKGADAAQMFFCGDNFFAGKKRSEPEKIKT